MDLYKYDSNLTKVGNYEAAIKKYEKEILNDVKNNDVKKEDYMLYIPVLHEAGKFKSLPKQYQDFALIENIDIEEVLKSDIIVDFLIKYSSAVRRFKTKEELQRHFDTDYQKIINFAKTFYNFLKNKSNDGCSDVFYTKGIRFNVTVLYQNCKQIIENNQNRTKPKIFDEIDENPNQFISTIKQKFPLHTDYKAIQTELNNIKKRITFAEFVDQFGDNVISDLGNDKVSLQYGQFIPIHSNNSFSFFGPDNRSEVVMYDDKIKNILDDGKQIGFVFRFFNIIQEIQDRERRLDQYLGVNYDRIIRFAEAFDQYFQKNTNACNAAYNDFQANVIKTDCDKILKKERELQNNKQKDQIVLLKNSQFDQSFYSGGTFGGGQNSQKGQSQQTSKVKKIHLINNESANTSNIINELPTSCVSISALGNRLSPFSGNANANPKLKPNYQQSQPSYQNQNYKPNYQQNYPIQTNRPNYMFFEKDHANGYSASCNNVQVYSSNGNDMAFFVKGEYSNFINEAVIKQYLTELIYAAEYLGKKDIIIDKTLFDDKDYLCIYQFLCKTLSEKKFNGSVFVGEKFYKFLDEKYGTKVDPNIKQYNQDIGSLNTYNNNILFATSKTILDQYNASCKLNNVTPQGLMYTDRKKAFEEYIRKNFGNRKSKIPLIAAFLGIAFDCYACGMSKQSWLAEIEKYKLSPGDKKILQGGFEVARKVVYEMQQSISDCFRDDQNPRKFYGPKQYDMIECIKGVLGYKGFSR